MIAWHHFLIITKSFSKTNRDDLVDKWSKKSKLKFNKPSIDLYPDTSWQILKKKHKDKYQKFKEYETNSKDKILTFEKIYEISNYIQKIDRETIDSIV